MLDTLQWQACDRRCDGSLRLRGRELQQQAMHRRRSARAELPAESCRIPQYITTAWHMYALRLFCFAKSPAMGADSRKLSHQVRRVGPWVLSNEMPGTLAVATVICLDLVTGFPMPSRRQSGARPQHVFVSRTSTGLPGSVSTFKVSLFGGSISLDLRFRAPSKHNPS